MQGKDSTQPAVATRAMAVTEGARPAETRKEVSLAHIGYLCVEVYMASSILCVSVHSVVKFF